MFQNREFRVRVAKIDNTAPEPIDPIHSPLTKTDVIDIAKDVAKWSALAVGFVVVCAAATHTVSEIAIQRFGNPT
jgi:hypothetical protein